MNIAPNIDNNPLKAKPQAASQRPALPHHLQQAASDKDSRRLMKRSMVMVLPTK